MIQNSERIQSMLNNILEQVQIMKNDFNTNGQTHYEYILEKLNKAQWDLLVMLSMASEVKEKMNNENRN